MPKTKQFDEAEVLEKAKELFTEKGYNGTSMDDLVQVTGLSRSSIYDTFGDKHGLFLKSLDQYQCSEQSNLQQLCEKTTSPKKKIGVVFDSIVKDIIADKKGKGCLMINASMELSCVDKEIARIANANMERMEALFCQWIKEGQATQEIARDFSPRALARFLYNNLTGLRTNGRSRPDPNALREIVKVTLSVLEE